MCALARALVRVLPAVAAVVWIVATVLQNNAKTDLVFSFARPLASTVETRESIWGFDVLWAEYYTNVICI